MQTPLPTFRIVLVMLISAVSIGGLAYGQKYEQPEPTLATPYNTMLNHLYFLQPESYNANKAGITIPVSDSTEAARLAVRLKQVYDGLGYFIDLESTPTDPNFFDSTHMQYRYAPLRAELPTVYLTKRNNRWQYSAETIADIPRLHREIYPFGADLLMNMMPQSAQKRVLGLAIWQYVGLLLLMVILYILHWLFSRILRPLILNLIKQRFHYLSVEQNTVKSISRFLSIIVMVSIARFIIPIVQLPIELSEIAMIVLRIIFIVSLVLATFKLVDIFRGRARELAERTTSRMDEQLLPIISRIIKIVIGFIGLIHILNLLNINVTALIAGLSIGGLALALAAQDTVKNLIGSIMILFDRPFQIGDYVTGGDIEGTVVEVGFRSTRIQTLDTSIVTVPNGRVADMSVRNLGVRTQRVMNETLTIEYSTPPDMIEQFNEGLKHIIASHPYTVKDTAHVYLKGMADSSIQIMFRTYFIVPDYAAELKCKQDVLFDIMRLAEALGVQWAFPSRTVYQGSGDFIPSQDRASLDKWKNNLSQRYSSPDGESINND